MLYLNKHSSKRRIERGQSLIELSISMLFFLIFLLGLLDLGRVYFYFIALEDSAGEAAIFLAINPECNYPAGYTGDPDVGTYPLDAAAPAIPDVAPADGVPDTADPCGNPNNAFFRAKRASGNFFSWEDATVDVDYVTGGKGIGNTVRVELSYPFQLWTPIINQIIGDDTLTIRALATQTIMME